MIEKTLIIFFGTYGIVVSILILGAFFFWRDRASQRQMLRLALVSFPLSFIVNEIAHRLFFNPRPFVILGVQPLIAHAADNGFPSDHAVLSMAIASLAFVMNRRIGIGLAVLSVLIGLARVGARVHHPVDVLAGMAIAMVSTWVSQQYIQWRYRAIIKRGF